MSFFQASGDLNVLRMVGGFTLREGFGATFGGVISRFGDGVSVATASTRVCGASTCCTTRGWNMGGGGCDVTSGSDMCRSLRLATLGFWRADDAVLAVRLSSVTSSLSVASDGFC